MRFLHYLLLACSYLYFLPSTAAASLSIIDVRFGQHPGANRLVIELSQATDFRTFILTAPNRLVIDLPEFQWKPASVQNITGSFVGKIRQGVLEPGTSRIVLDLDRSAEIYKAYLLKPAYGKGNRLVIDYGTLKTAAGQKKRFGTLASLSPAKPTTPKTESAIEHPLPIAKAVKKTGKQKIVIDAGHGGVDPGAVGKGNVYEKDITLSISRELAKQLKATGRFDVVMTRNDDRFIKLHQRVVIARKAKGDLFISIHADSIRNNKVTGASVYTLSDKASDAQTARLAARENKADLLAGVDLDVEDKEVANILLDLVRRDTMNQSKFFANSLVSGLGGSGVKMLERPHRSAGFAVLKAPDIPSVLVETGFISNASEAKKLQKRSHQKKIARAIKDGVEEYFDKLAYNQSL